MTNPPDHFCPYFLVFLLYVEQVFCSFLKSWLRDKVHILWSEPISCRSISAEWRPAKNHLAATEPLTRLTRWGRGEQGAADTAGSGGQEPGINWAVWSAAAESRPGLNRALIVCSRHHSTQLNSALCRPHTHTSLHSSSPFWAAAAFLVKARH